VSRRAGLGYAAAAVVLLVTAGTGCGSPAGHSPAQGHPRRLPLSWWQGPSRCRGCGAATAVIASTRALGLTGIPEVWILRSALIQLLSTKASWRQGQVILYPDGRLYARMPEPRGDVAGIGALSASPGRRAVAYILTKEPGNSPTVYVVRPGGAPAAVYRATHGGSPCTLPPLAWHGSWLLYTPQGGRAVLIDAEGSHRIIRLPSTLPAGNGHTVRVRAISWR